MPVDLIEYVGDEVITFSDVAAQCRVDTDDERAWIESVVIPSARQAAESRTGSAIREAVYEERVTGPIAREIDLSIGQAHTMQRVEIRVGNEWREANNAAYDFIKSQRVSTLLPIGSELMSASGIRMTYIAGANLEKFPGVRSWMLRAAAWMYAHREFGVTNLPMVFDDDLLMPITQVPRF